MQQSTDQQQPQQREDETVAPAAAFEEADDDERQRDIFAEVTMDADTLPRLPSPPSPCSVLWLVRDSMT